MSVCKMWGNKYNQGLIGMAALLLVAGGGGSAQSGETAQIAQQEEIAVAVNESDGAVDSTAPLVIVSIKPIHSLVAGIMKGAGEPVLLVKGGSSPHSFQLKPSDAALIEKAELIVRVGPSLEVSLNRVLESLSKPSRIIDVIELKDLTLLKFRSEHHHDHDEHKDHENDEHAGHVEGGEDNPETDPHLWLNVDNARQIVLQISNRLILMDPSNGGLYERNATELLKKLKQLSDETSAQMRLVTGKGYMVFHDAYQYFTKPYGLKFAGAITLNPSTPASAKHLKELRDELKNDGVSCVFSEPQYSDKLLMTLTEGSDVKTGSLDPIGIDITDGEEAYFTMMRNMTKSMTDCLK